MISDFSILASGGIALAQETGMEIAARSAGDYVPDMTVALVVIVLMILGLGLWQLASSPAVRRAIPEVAVAKYLFLKFRFSKAGESDVSGHLRSLGLREAYFVTHAPIEKGDTVEIDLQTLPDFPTVAGESLKTLSATVRSVRSLRGTPESFYVLIKFDKLDTAQSRALRTYVCDLARVPGRPVASHG